MQTIKVRGHDSTGDGMCDCVPRLRKPSHPSSGGKAGLGCRLHCTTLGIAQFYILHSEAATASPNRHKPTNFSRNRTWRQARSFADRLRCGSMRELGKTKEQDCTALFISQAEIQPTERSPCFCPIFLSTVIDSCWHMNGSRIRRRLVRWSGWPNEKS